MQWLLIIIIISTVTGGGGGPAGAWICGPEVRSPLAAARRPFPDELRHLDGARRRRPFCPARPGHGAGLCNAVQPRCWSAGVMMPWPCLDWACDDARSVAPVPVWLSSHATAVCVTYVCCAVPGSLEASGQALACFPLPATHQTLSYLLVYVWLKLIYVPCSPRVWHGATLTIAYPSGHARR